jgi:AcrR family transcriptional regulator
VLEAATRLFAERGFNHTTVRQICRAAKTNLASVNYHFGGKEGLYREILGAAIEAMRRTNQEAIEAGEGGTAEERLRAHIRVFLRRILGQGRNARVHQILLRETVEPTPALDLVVERGILPRFRYLSELTAELVDREPDDPRVARAVGSIHALCAAYQTNPFATRVRAHFPSLERVAAEPEEIDALADEIADFALGGLRAMREDGNELG